MEAETVTPPLAPPAIPPPPTLLDALHARFCREAEWEPDDSYYWLRSHVTLVAAATALRGHLGTLTYADMIGRCSEDQAKALAFSVDDPARLLTEADLHEWLMKAGEIRLILHAGWGGRWDHLAVHGAYDAFADHMREAVFNAGGSVQCGGGGSEGGGAPAK
jgi:hypothetical protein